MAIALAGCGGDGGGGDDKLPTRAPSLGPTKHHRPQSLGPKAARGEPIAGMRCTRGEAGEDSGAAGADPGAAGADPGGADPGAAGSDPGSARRYGVHLELFAGKRIVLVAPGIGVAPPRTREGAYVRGGRCTYPLLTREPTGVIEVAGRGRTRTLGDLFAIWGQPLGTHRMAGFKGSVSAFVGGKRWRGDPRKIPLTRHAQIVLEVDGYVRPHATYRFPPGL
jgi:hypothetical protein